MPTPDSNSATICPEQKQNYKEIIPQFKNINMFCTESMISNSFRPELLALGRSGQELLAKNVLMTILHKFQYFSINLENIG